MESGTRCKKILTGISVSEGWALAKAFCFEQEKLSIRKELTKEDERKQQVKLFLDAVTKAQRELDDLYEFFSKQDEENAKIFLAHSELLKDEVLLGQIRTRIEDKGKYAECAIEEVFTAVTDKLAEADDTVIAQRVADLLDVKRRLLCICQNRERKSPGHLQEDVVVIAQDLLPSEMATMDRAHIKGIVTESGAVNSHSAILARSFGIPAVLGVAGACSVILEGEKILLNAADGKVLVNPDTEDELLFFEMQERIRAINVDREQYRSKPCILRDGRKIEIGLNIDSTQFESEEGLFDFVGLFRTEFLYLRKDRMPSEEEQFEAYKAVIERAKGRRVTLRTLDIGGDKALPYMKLPKEENPALGKRAIRLCFEKEGMFLTQLRAALRASAYGPLQLMFPMVGSMEDIFRAKTCVEKAKTQLRRENVAFDEDIKVGIMIETPSIALIADLVACEVDFASVGTNDLTQYLCAADRTNEAMAEYYQSDSTAMFRLLGFVFEAFDKQGKPVSVCGEMAGRPKSAVRLVQIGAKKLSMAASFVPAVKEALIKAEL